MYTALHKADAALPLLDREIFVTRLAAGPFYLPRFFAAAVGLGGRRRMPAAAARSAAAAVRGVARVQLSLHNLLRDGVDGIVKDVLCERYPAALLPDIVKLARSAIQVPYAPCPLPPLSAVPATSPHPQARRLVPRRPVGTRRCGVAAGTGPSC